MLFAPTKFTARRKTLASAIALLLCSSTLTAQESQIEEIVVTSTPIRDSQLAALEAKRNALNMSDVVAADTIGRFPDQNLADSLGRLPGLAIERDQGQARFINLRGAPFRYTSIAFDGIDVPGAENGRIPRFDSFPSVITSRVEANKAILPSMPGDSIAGHINIHTFNPFDQEGFAVNADLGLGNQSLGDGDIDKGGLRASWSNEQFGVVGFFSENSRDQVTDNREYDLAIDPATGAPIVKELDFRSYLLTRSDSAQGGTVEWRGTGAVQRVFASTLYSEFVDTEERNQFVFALPGTVGVTGYSAAGAVSRLLEDGQYDNSTLTNTVGMDIQVADWFVEGRYNQTETERNQFLPIAYDIGLAAASYDISDLEDPLLTIYARGTRNPILPGQITYNVRNLGLIVADELNNEASKIKFDAERDMALFGTSATVKVGVQMDERDAEGYSTQGIGASPVSAGINVESFNTGKPWESMTSNPLNASIYNNVGLRAAWEASPVWRLPVPADNQRILIEEEVTSLYAMATLEYPWGNVVLGARNEMTDYTSKGTIAGRAISVSDDFSNLLPSAHVNVDVSETVKLRISGSTGISRPTYNEWRAGASVDFVNKKVSGGNPTLEAEETMGFDTALEWYFAPASILSAGAFHRAIDNVIYADSSVIDGGLYTPAGAGELWEYTGNVNGKDGELSGIEVNVIAYLNDIYSSLPEGLGFSANLTLLDSKFKGIRGNTYQLPGTSDTIYNASVFYENFGLSARLNYQYRDEWISPIESPDEVWGEQQRVDLSIAYELPWEMAGATASVYLNGNNLTDEVDLRFAGNGTVNQRESYGRSYLMGVRVGF
jgi:TonB-dependent receptor